MLFILILLTYFSECFGIIRNCEKNSVIRVWNTTLSPVKRGREISLDIDLISTHQITDAVATYITRYNYLPAYRYSEKLDTIILGSSRKTMKYNIPTYAYGNILVEMKWVSPIYGTLFCITIEKDL